ncbi:hypothetical protein ACL02T_16500 [Pseudonocardia sp. RS010]|uniref:hypothetical protein n=1 Tax=Pseudonocardia sp. RS010 TaxID=3385979 RepID=UPI0039A2BA39
MSAPPAPSTHHLLLALAGRVDDDLLATARELVAIGEEPQALEILVATLVADRTALPAPLRSEVVELARRRAIELDADGLLARAAGSLDGTRHVFGAGPAGADERIAELLISPPPGSTVRLTWRMTPAGAAPGPVPHPVVLVELSGPGIAPEVVSYRLGAHLLRSGLPASVEAYTPADALPAYQRAALERAREVGAPAGVVPAAEPDEVGAAAGSGEPPSARAAGSGRGETFEGSGPSGAREAPGRSGGPRPGPADASSRPSPSPRPGPADPGTRPPFPRPALGRPMTSSRPPAAFQPLHPQPDGPPPGPAVPRHDAEPGSARPEGTPPAEAHPGSAPLPEPAGPPVDRPRPRPVPVPVPHGTGPHPDGSRPPLGPVEMPPDEPRTTPFERTRASRRSGPALSVVPPTPGHEPPSAPRHGPVTRPTPVVPADAGLPAGPAPDHEDLEEDPPVLASMRDPLSGPLREPLLDARLDRAETGPLPVVGPAAEQGSPAVDGRAPAAPDEDAGSPGVAEEERAGSSDVRRVARDEAAPRAEARAADPGGKQAISPGGGQAAAPGGGPAVASGGDQATAPGGEQAALPTEAQPPAQAEAQPPARAEAQPPARAETEPEDPDEVPGRRRRRRAEEPQREPTAEWTREWTSGAWAMPAAGPHPASGYPAADQPVGRSASAPHEDITDPTGRSSDEMPPPAGAGAAFAAPMRVGSHEPGGPRTIEQAHTDEPADADPAGPGDRPGTTGPEGQDRGGERADAVDPAASGRGGRRRADARHSGSEFPNGSDLFGPRDATGRRSGGPESLGGLLDRSNGTRHPVPTRDGLAASPAAVEPEADRTDDPRHGPLRIDPLDPLGSAAAADEDRTGRGSAGGHQAADGPASRPGQEFATNDRPAPAENSDGSGPGARPRASTAPTNGGTGIPAAPRGGTLPGSGPDEDMAGSRLGGEGPGSRGGGDAPGPVLGGEAGGTRRSEDAPAPLSGGEAPDAESPGLRRGSSPASGKPTVGDAADDPAVAGDEPPTGRRAARNGAPTIRPVPGGRRRARHRPDDAEPDPWGFVTDDAGAATTPDAAPRPEEGPQDRSDGMPPPRPVPRTIPRIRRSAEQPVSGLFGPGEVPPSRPDDPFGTGARSVSDRDDAEPGGGTAPYSTTDPVGDAETSTPAPAPGPQNPPSGPSPGAQSSLSSREQDLLRLLQQELAVRESSPERRNGSGPYDPPDLAG